MIRVNTETCIGCGMCEKDCLASAIRVEDGKAKVKMNVWNVDIVWLSVP